MKVLVTSHNVKILELFLKHKNHQSFINENLYIYWDKDDYNELEPIKNLLVNVNLYNREDLKSHFGKYYMEDLKTLNKVYFMSMLMELNILNGEFYFTDDDVLCYENFIPFDYDDSFFMRETDRAHPLNVYYKGKGWLAMKTWFENNATHSFTPLMATNFFIHKKHLLKKKFCLLFNNFIQTLYEDKEFIDNLTLKKRGKRIPNVLFLLDTLFLSAFYAQHVKEFTFLNFKKASYNTTKDCKDSYEEQEFVINMVNGFRKKWPESQPLFHFNIVDKVPIMTNYFTYLNI